MVYSSLSDAVIVQAFGCFNDGIAPSRKSSSGKIDFKELQTSLIEKYDVKKDDRITDFRQPAGDPGIRCCLAGRV